MTSEAAGCKGHINRKGNLESVEEGCEEDSEYQWSLPMFVTLLEILFND